MSIPSPIGAKLLEELKRANSSFSPFIVSFTIFSIFVLLLQTNAYAGEVSENTSENLSNNSIFYQYSGNSQENLLLRPQNSLFTPNFLHIYGKNFNYDFFSYAKTVDEAITEAGLLFDEDDIFEPAINEPILGDMWIKYTKVDSEIEKVEIVIPFKTSYILDASSQVGQNTVIINGKSGIKTEIYKLTYENGIQVSRKLQSSEITSNPVEEVIAKGTSFGGTKTCIEWDEVIDTKTSDPTERFWLKSVMRCESGCNELSVDRSGNFKGLFQYSSNTFSSTAAGFRSNGMPYDNIFDGEQQIEQTLLRYRGGQGSAAWPTCGPLAQDLVQNLN